MIRGAHGQPIGGRGEKGQGIGVVSQPPAGKESVNQTPAVVLSNLFPDDVEDGPRGAPTPILVRNHWGQGFLYAEKATQEGGESRVFNVQYQEFFRLVPEVLQYMLVVGVPNLNPPEHS